MPSATTIINLTNIRLARAGRAYWEARARLQTAIANRAPATLRRRLGEDARVHYAEFYRLRHLLKLPRSVLYDVCDG